MEVRPVTRRPIGRQRRFAWLKRGDDDERQRRLHKAASECFGSIASGDTRRSETASATVRQRLRRHSFRQLRLPLVTSEGVLTELFHLVGDNRKEMESAWKLLRSGAIEPAAITHAELPQVHALMSGYGDRPMDFADATLVHLARRESLSTIFTVDHADLETYRIEGRRRFRELPEKRP